MGQLAAFCLVTDNTLHVRLADYAMMSTMAGRYQLQWLFLIHSYAS
jgi:hypothetical protein